MQLVVSDAHGGLKKAVAHVLGCPWQRCSVHFRREALCHARREQQPMLAALLRPLFTAETGEQARELVREALEQLAKPLPKLATLVEEGEDDLLASTARAHCKLRSTNRLERVNREIGRGTDVVGIFPNDRAPDPPRRQHRDRTERRMTRRAPLPQQPLAGRGARGT